MARPTIRDVAQKAGVGVGTASRVLNNSTQVRPATRERVLAAIRELGYKPNLIAQQLPRKTHVGHIGVITQPFLTYHAFSERLQGVQTQLSQLERDYELMLYSVSSLEHFHERLSQITHTAAVDGLIIIDFDLDAEQIALLRASGRPFVGLNHYQNRDWPCIGADNVDGGYRATRYLLELGHQRIAYVGDYFLMPFNFVTGHERYRGYERAMLEAGQEIDAQLVKLGPYGADPAREMAHELFQLTQPPSAIFAMSDTQALGVMAAAQDAGWRVPDDVSIMGYDDLDMSRHIGLTTVAQHLKHSGELAIQHLLHHLDADAYPRPPSLPPPTVIPRLTTRTYRSATTKRDHS